MGEILHASYSGYFPTCIIEGTPTPTEQYLSLTLEQAMALFWRVKTWRAKASGSFHDEVLEATIAYTSSSFVDMTPNVIVDEEQNLVCYGNRTFYFERDATATITPDESEDPYDGDGTINFQYNFSSINKGGSTYYPYVLFGSINSASSTDGGGAKIGTYKITYLNFEISGDLFGSDGSSGSASIQIDAKEYWSYGGTYDTSTGSRL
jgi:hypothetical protein